MTSKGSLKKSKDLEFSQPTRPTLLMVLVLVLVFAGAFLIVFSGISIWWREGVNTSKVVSG